MRNRYKVVWAGKAVSYDKPYTRTLATARKVALELILTKVPCVRPTGAWILRRRVLRKRGIKWIDWQPIETLGKVPA